MSLNSLEEYDAAIEAGREILLKIKAMLSQHPEFALTDVNKALSTVNDMIDSLDSI